MPPAPPEIATVDAADVSTAPAPFPRENIPESIPEIVREEETPPVDGPQPSYRGLERDDVLNLSWEEIRDSADFEIEREANIEAELFGEEGARRYDRAQRTANSQMSSRERLAEADRIIEEMESALTEEQRNRLFGIGETGLNAEQMQAIRREVDHYAPEAASQWTDEDLENVVGREFVQGKPDTDVVVALRLRGALEELFRRGKSTEDVVKAVGTRALTYGISPGDAMELATRTIDSLKDKPWMPRPKAPKAPEPAPMAQLTEGSSRLTSEVQADPMPEPEPVWVSLPSGKRRRFIPTRDGNADLGRFSEEMVSAIREKAPELDVEPLPIRLDAQNRHRRKHRQLTNHVEGLKDDDYFRFVAGNFERIYRGRDGSLILMAFKDGGQVSYVRLDKKEGYWDIATGHSVKESKVRSWEDRLLWESGHTDPSDADRTGPLEHPPVSSPGGDGQSRTGNGLIGPQQTDFSAEKVTETAPPSKPVDLDVNEGVDDSPTGGDAGLPFDPDTDRIANQRKQAERSDRRGQVTRKLQREVGTSSRTSVGYPDGPTDPLAPPEAEEVFARKMKGRLKAAEDYAERTSAPAVVKALANAVRAAGADVPIRTGRLGTKNALGIFKVDAEVIRLLEANNIPTSAHEVGHAIEKAVYGWPKGGPWKNPRVGRSIQKELHQLGRALYGDTQPAGGYKREGWAEFTRLWVTDPDVLPTSAPKLTAWFESEFSQQFPKVREALDEARREAKIWQEQGSRARAEESIVDKAAPAERAQRAADKVARSLTMEEWIEIGQPLADLAAAAERKTGQQLPADQNPYTLFSGLAMTHSTRARYMVENAMIDLAGNPVGGSLDEAISIVRGRKTDFTLYLWARRAAALWYDPNGPRNPGLTLTDAKQIIKELETPEFQLAAQKVYDWQNGVLEYAAEASSDFRRVVENIRERDPGDYLPLKREFDELDEMFATKGMGGAARGSLVKRLKGSGRRIKDPFPVMISQAEGTIRQAHRRMVIEQILKLAEIDGLGHIIEEVPVNRVPVASATITDLIDRMNRELDSRGLDASVGIDGEVDHEFIDSALTFFAPAPQPGGAEAIIPVYKDGRMHWYQVDPKLYAALDGLDVYRLPDTAGLLGMAVKGVEKTAEVFRAGTTTMRASFGLVVNPARDVQTLMVNSRAHGSGRELLGAYLSSMADAAFNQVGGVPSPYLDAFIRLGGEMSQSLGQDIPHTRRAAHRLFQNRRVRAMDPRNWFDFYRSLIQFPESAPRVAELKLVARDIGWEPGTPMTLAQSLELLTAAKQVTVDFSAGGRFARAINRTWNFFNVSFQGPRSMVRAAKRDPAKFALRGISSVTIPSLLLWWQNKDEEWWHEVPYADRLLNWYIPFDNPFTGAAELIQIPKAHDSGTLFGSLPVMLMDSWYNEDPEQAKAFFVDAFQFLSPVSEPSDIFNIGGPVLKETAQQLANKNFFFDSPIVSRSLERLPAEEQYNEYTSRAAIAIGKALKVSPQRIDHAIRNVAGPAASDLVDVFGFGPPDLGREKELADLPVIGRGFRRAGQEGTRLRSVDELYDELEKAQRRQASKENPETESERERRLQLNDAIQAVSALSAARRATPSYSMRQTLTREIGSISRDAMRSQQGGVIQRERFAEARRRAERLEESFSKQPASATSRR